jgi:uncharacterized membrane protein YesL
MMELLVPFKLTWQAVRLWLEELATNVVINLFWVLSWLTIVLGPPATFSLFQVTRTVVEGYFPTRKDFLDGIKRYFAISWLWMLVNLVVLALFAINLSFYGNFQARWSTYVQGMFVGLLLLWLGIQFFSLPYLIIQEDKSLRVAWKNSLLTLLASPIFGLIVGVFAFLIILLSIFIVVPIFLGAGSLLAILANLAVQNRLEKFNLAASLSGQDDQKESQHQKG